MGRPPKKQPPRLERVDLPADMARSVTDLAERRAWPLVAEAIAHDRPLKKAVRDVYMQGVWDGYMVAERHFTSLPVHAGMLSGL